MIFRKISFGYSKEMNGDGEDEGHRLFRWSK